MIDLYTWPTPNGRKITIMLEELDVPYKVYLVDIDNNEQFSDNFSQISPANKIPAIIDNENKQSIFESGAIILYLAKKYKKFISQKYHWETMEWLMFQTTEYSIADISTWPWITHFERQRITLNKYPNVLRWYSSIMKRPAVIKGYNAIGEKERIPF